MERMNLFNPFNEKPPEHEDRLTWAFLAKPAFQKSTISKNLNNWRETLASERA